MWNKAAATLAGMAEDLKKVLWENVLELMKDRYEEGENLNRLARDAKLGPGTAQRIKDQETSVGIDIIGKIAKGFSVPAYTLLIPKADRNVLRFARIYGHTDERGLQVLETALEVAEQRAGNISTGVGKPGSSNDR